MDGRFEDSILIARRIKVTTLCSLTFSPGYGKTTCAFIQSGTGNILFGSTHHDPRSKELQKEELDFRASGQERRYSWDYDPEMEIYVFHNDTGELERLTHSHGYDAEASYSPDGEWIVFSSMRDAYGRELSADEQKTLEAESLYFRGDLHHARGRLGANSAHRRPWL